MQIKNSCFKELALVEPTKHALLLKIEGRWLQDVYWVNLKVFQHEIEHVSNCVVTVNELVALSKDGRRIMPHIVLNKINISPKIVVKVFLSQLVCNWVNCV